MKCPKCHYLGFETGERCKNCGYDFSLIVSPLGEPAEADLTLKATNDQARPLESWLERFDSLNREVTDALAGPDGLDIRIDLGEPTASLESVRPSGSLELPASASGVRQGPSVPAGDAEAALPLFTSAPSDEQPLVRMTAAPRPPLSVRRTPDTSKARIAGRSGRNRAPLLEFGGEVAGSASKAEPLGSVEKVASPDGMSIGGAGRRFGAAMIDHLILSAIDAGVIYFTLRMVAMPWSSVLLLPLAPLMVFLGLVKLSYFWAFTAAGGQTIGKMAARICVVSEDGEEVDAARALHRAVTGAVSVLTLGFGLVPILFDSDRRALHDRIAHTRVVQLRSA